MKSRKWESHFGYLLERGKVLINKRQARVVRQIFGVQGPVQSREVPNRVVIYTRSATDDSRRGLALAAQVQTCRQWAATHRCVVVGEFAEIESGNAATLPELAKALKQARHHKAALLCTEPSRLGRSPRLYQKRIKACQQCKVVVLFVHRG